MNVTIRAAIACAAVMLSGAANSAWGQAKSGIYGQLTLGVDETVNGAAHGATVTGVFADSRVGNGTDDAPQFTCIFALRGTLVKGEAAVTTWFPGDAPADKQTITGTLTLTGDTAKLRLKEQPGGCDMTGDEFTKEPYAEPSVKDGAWTAVRMVGASRADFVQAPVNGSSRKGYVVKGDGVVVYRHVGAWADAEYLNGRRPVRGWLRESDLFPDHP